MGSHRSKEDDVSRISISIFVSNFPDSFSAKELFQTCKQYGHVVDSFIPQKRTKEGNHFGFVCFINVFNVDRLVNNLCTIWVGRLKLHANLARFQRAPLNKEHKPDLPKGAVHRNVVNSSRPISSGNFGSAKSYVNVVTNVNEMSKLDSPAIVLDDDCVLSKDLSNSLMGRIKEFASLTNLKNALMNEGFVDLNVKYIGELWVLLEFSSIKSKEAFRVNVGVSSWFSELRQASLDINPDGHIVWVDVEGVPLKLWTMNTFKKIANKWGDLINFDDFDDNYFYSKRLCLVTKSISNIYEYFKITFRGKVYWIRAKEVPGWIPDLVEELDEEELSDDDILNVDEKNLDDENYEDRSDSDAVTKTIFEKASGKNQNSSEDPFGLYPLLNKKTKGQNHKVNGSSSSLKFPSGFTPNNETIDSNVMGEKSVNGNEEAEPNRDPDFFNNNNSKADDVESVSIGQFKKIRGTTFRGFFHVPYGRCGESWANNGLQHGRGGLAHKTKKDWAKELCFKNKVNFLAIQETKMEEIDLFSVRSCWGNSVFDHLHSNSVGNSGRILCVWDPYAYRKISFTISDFFIIIRGVWLTSGIDLMIIAVYAHHNPRDKRMLWDYLAHAINQWHGEAVIMGDFNEVRVKSDRVGSHFNAHGANVFNSFINSAGLEELDGFNAFVTGIWNSAPTDEFNGMRNLSGKLKFLKSHIKTWIKDNRCERVSSIANLKKELRLVDEVIDKGACTEEDVIKKMDVLAALCNTDRIHSMDLAQKAKIKWSIEGDENSKFFHGILNKKRNQMNIRGIMVYGVWNEQPNDVKREFLKHFQGRFAKPSEWRASIDMGFPNTISDDQCQDLEREVSKEEIKAVVWDCGIDKSPGPDGFSFGFYRHFWSVIKLDVYKAVNHFFIHGDIPSGCNSSFIALIPKVPDANLVKDFRPISLIGSIYKIIAKILSNRLISVLGDIVSDVQSASIARRQMLDGPFILNEIVDAGLFKGIVLDQSLCLSHMFYADDVIFVGHWSEGNISTLIHVLKCFFHASGLRINLSKSRIMGVNVENAYFKQAAAKLGCLVLHSPFYYLGTKVGGSMSRVQAWQEIVEKVKSRLSNWKMKTLSIGGRSTLLKSVLGSISVFHMSLFKVPSKVLNHLESIRMQFFNGQNLGSRKASWVKWHNVLADKKRDGLGVSSLFSLNRGLMLKWVWKFLTQKDSLWTKVIVAIHGVDGKVHSTWVPPGKSCWLSILNEVWALQRTCGVLKNSFPRMFALENHKEISVSYKLGNPDLSSSFRRIPSGGAEQNQFDSLMELVSSINLVPMADRWVWKLEGTGVFSVASARRLFDELRLPNLGMETRWIKCVPIKVNVLAWKIWRDALPTRFNISRRGLKLRSVGTSG
nr:RNA-directed DNA polymerase, eukaryota [Tanacetum cinerariifolium]